MLSVELCFQTMIKFNYVIIFSLNASMMYLQAHNRPDARKKSLPENSISFEGKLVVTKF